MFTSEEQLQRLISLLQDAFRGHPPCLEREGDHWVGKVQPDSREPVILHLRNGDRGSYSFEAWAVVPEGHKANECLPGVTGFTPRTCFSRYQEAAHWAYSLASKLNWVVPYFITSRHFAYLANKILQQEMTYNEIWPHPMTWPLKNGVVLKAEWGVDRYDCCCLVARLVTRSKGSETLGDLQQIQSPGDAIGLLSWVRMNHL